MAQNYTLGRGKLYFAPFADGTQNPKGERFLGNVPEFNLTIEEEKLEHFSSTQGIREKDDSVSLQVNRTGTLSTDNIDVENVALFFFGSTDSLAVTGSTITDEAIAAVEQGMYYQLGVTADRPTGHRELDLLSTGPDVNILVTDDAGTPVEFDEGDDYEIDMVLGRIYIVPGGAITDGTNLEVDYKTKTSTRPRVISGSAPIEGSLRYIAANPKGTDFDYFMPWVQLAPNGDYTLISDEWQTIPFNIEVLKKTGLEAIYVDGRALVS